MRIALDTQTEDARLVARMAEGDDKALAELYDRYHRLVYSLVLRVVGNATEAEDSVVEIFCRIWERAGQYEPAGTKVSTWLLRAAREMALERRRRLEHESNFQFINGTQEPHIGSPARKPEDVEGTEREVEAALQEIPASQRQVIEMAYYTGLNQGQLARELTLPSSTVRDLVQDGLSSLRRILNVP